MMMTKLAMQKSKTRWKRFACSERERDGCDGCMVWAVYANWKIKIK